MLVTELMLRIVCMGKRFHLINASGPSLGGKVAYVVTLEAVGVV